MSHVEVRAVSQAFGFVSEGTTTCIALLECFSHPFVMKALGDGITVSSGGEICILHWEDVRTIRDFFNTAWRERI